MKIMLSIILGILVFVISVRYIEKTSIFYPSKNVGTTPRDVGLDFEDISLKTSDGLALNGWLISNPKARATLLFFHGNAGNLSHRLEKILIFHNMGLNIFIIDYRGYGKSQGAPSESGLYQDALAAYDYLASRKDTDMRNLIFYGESLGGAVAVDLAAKKDCAALIADSSIPSAADMARKIYPFIPTFLLATKMDSVTKVKNITAPKLFIHSPDDEIVPFALGKKLFDAACEPKEFLEIQGSHNTGFLDDNPAYTLGIQKFLKKLNLI